LIRPLDLSGSASISASELSPLVETRAAQSTSASDAAALINSTVTSLRNSMSTGSPPVIGLPLRSSPWPTATLAAASDTDRPPRSRKIVRARSQVGTVGARRGAMTVQRMLERARKFERQGNYGEAAAAYAGAADAMEGSGEWAAAV